MNAIATITSKKQLTLPSKIFEKAGLKEGEKVIVSEENGSIKITPAVKLVEQLGGILKMPKKWKNKPLDQIIEESAKEYYEEKYKKG